MNIQLFASVYDEMLSDVNKQKQQVQSEMNNLTTEKQNALDTYEANYQSQLSGYNDLMAQQEQNINTWAETQKEQQQKQTDYNIGLIEQNKQEAEKQTKAEVGNAYIDYQKAMNRYTGSAETLASQGLGGTGYAQNQDIAMNITYQNRVSSAKSALQKANIQYDNQIQQALLTNDAALAEIALQQMQQNYQLALQGFDYRTNLENNKLAYIQNINDTYFSKQNTLQSRMDAYNQLANTIKTEEQDANLKKQQIAQQAELERKQMAWEREKFYAQLNAQQNALNYYNDYTDTTADNTGTTNTTSTGKKTSILAQVGDSVAQELANKKYTSNVNPRLSGATASKWYQANIFGKDFTKSELKNLLQSAYNSKKIKADDVKQILWAYGLE